MRLFKFAAVLAVSAAAVLPFAASAAAAPDSVALAKASTVFPTTIALPNGFEPEGLTIRGTFAWTGSLATGTIARIDLRDGHVTVLAAGPGTASVGMKVDNRGRLFVGGGPSGEGRVVSAETGQTIATFPFTSAGFINDVVLTPHAAYFTDSVNPAIYKLPLGPAGALPPASAVTTIHLGGDFVTGPGFNANGISRTPDGKALIIDQTNTGKLFRVDPATGVATIVDLGGETLPNGDGIFLSGTTLFVVQNQNNLVATIKLAPDGRSGTVESRVTDPRFDVPTAVAPFGDRLYLVNARFNTPPTPDTTYTAVAIPRP
jgi:sugar lactone lactonase YvrE